MNQPPHQAGPSHHRGGFSDHNILPERHYDTRTVGNIQGQYLRGAINSPQESGAQHAYHDFYHRGYGNANAFSQYHATDLDFDADRSALHDRQASEPASPFAPRSDYALLRGIEKCAAETSPGTQSREVERRDAAFPQETSPTYSMARRSESVVSGSPALAPMQVLSQYSVDQNAAHGEQVPIRQTKYTPFQHHFPDTIAARDHRRLGTRFGRLPYVDPGSDSSIADIENNRIVHVERIYNAMTSGEAAKDNRGSIAMKRWVIEAHYPADLVEAYAHKVFDCLLAQAKYGFRGWVHNDYVADERKGEDIDKDVDCAGRLDNIILALEHEKTICEDVMNSACQIRMFVNAPRAYANRKHQNRVGNSKRGRTKDTPDPNPKPAKAQRTGGRRTRARSATTSDMPASRDTTPQHHQPPQHVPPPMPYFTPASQHFSLSPIIPSYPAPRSTPLHRPTLSAARSSLGQQSITAMSPPPAPSPLILHAPQSHIPRMATVPPHQQSPLMSPPPLSHGHYSAPATPDDAKPALVDAAFDGWHDANNLGALSCTAYQQSQSAIDPMLSHWDYANRTQCEEGRNSNFFDQHSSGFVNLSDIERPPSHHVGGSSNQGAFQDLWGTQHGVQNFPHIGGPSEHQN